MLDLMKELEERYQREVIKHDPAEFGGRQFAGMHDSQIKQRLCVAKGCAEMGHTQSGIMDADVPGELMIFIMCKKHLLLSVFVTLTALGDPDAMIRVGALGESLGVSLLEMTRITGPSIVFPRDFRCADCGGGQLAAETQGMFKGHRWVHTCGMTVAEAARLRPGEIEKISGMTRAPGFDLLAGTAGVIFERPDGSGEMTIQTEDAEPVRTAYCGPECNVVHTASDGCIYKGQSL